jgi:CubicO group peptidase (beta-lactamase class C family)
VAGEIDPGHAEPEGFEWTIATPESHGFKLPELDAFRDALADTNTKAFLLIHSDQIVYEWYSPLHSSERRHYTASMAKAIYGGLALGVAVDDGLISLDDQAASFISQWWDDSLKSQITIRQLGSHSSGIQDAWNAEESEAGVDKEDFPGWQGAFWRWRKREPGQPDDAFTLARDAAPVIFEPGTDWAYSNPGIGLMDYCVTASLKDAPLKDIRSLLRERIMRPIGISDDDWRCGSGKVEVVAGLPLVATWGGGSITARAVARIGRLMLKEGNWLGNQLLSPETVHAITDDAGTPGPNGMGWWSNLDGHLLTLPRDAYYGFGAGGQVVLVIPSLDVIAVRNGGNPPGQDKNSALKDYFFDPLGRILSSSLPTESPVASVPPLIRKISWAPLDQIVRKAEGSDNWPITWADDDALYTAYGDGYGFKPFVSEKLSLGLAKVAGNPPEIRGVNLRAPSLESTGNGISGHKASGILMVNGNLYLLVRNTDNSRLAWSNDHGANWSWADWKFTESMGAPSFINFGRNYRSARDGFVYLVSHDSDSAYRIADGFVLARAPVKRLRDKSAWEYFSGMVQELPTWTHDISKRAPILTAPGICYRVRVSYNAALDRYLLVHSVPRADSYDANGFLDTRFKGGIAIYEAPEPWGPWTTVYFTQEWDVAPGESAGFPTKWMSQDGLSMYLVFSGDDHFSVRKAELELTNESN